MKEGWLRLLPVGADLRRGAVVEVLVDLEGRGGLKAGPLRLGGGLVAGGMVGWTGRCRWEIDVLVDGLVELVERGWVVFTYLELGVK